jgi:hypothetical protein
MAISRGETKRRRIGVSAASLVVALAATLLGLSGCGGGSDSTAGSATSVEGRYVTAANLKHFEAGSPQATTLNWWKAVQFGNPGVAAAYYGKGAAPELEQLSRELSAASSQFVGVPKFNSADINAGSGTLYFFLGRPGSDAPPRPLSVNLVKEGGQWKLADNLLLEQQVARVAKLLRERDSSE